MNKKLTWGGANFFNRRFEELHVEVEHEGSMVKKAPKPAAPETSQFTLKFPQSY
jgi:hypothetical protein